MRNGEIKELSTKDREFKVMNFIEIIEITNNKIVNMNIMKILNGI